MVVQNRDVKQPPETKLFISGNHQTADFEDLSANKNQFTKVGDVKTVNEKSTTNPKYFPVGQDKGIYFDGTGDYLQSQYSADFDFGTGDFTIDFWVSFNSVSSNQTIWSTGVSSDANNEQYIAYSGTGKRLTFSSKCGGTTNGSYFMSFNPSANIWYHIAVVRSGSSCFMFVNGTSQSLTASTAFTGSLSSASKNMFISQYPYNSTESINGFLQNIRISKGIARWTSNFTPPALNSTYSTDSYTKLYIKGHDKAVNTTAMTDDSGTSKTITTYGDTKIGYSRGTAAYFDGTGDYLSCPRIDSGDYTKTTCVELWYYPLTLPTQADIIISSFGAANGTALLCTAGNTLGFAKWSDSLNFYNCTSNPSGNPLSLNKWHHIVGIWEAGTTTNGNIIFYINGTKYTTTKKSAGTCSLTQSAAQIGYYTSGSPEAVNGYISGLKYSEPIISPYIASSITPPETEPVPDAYTKLLMRNNVLNIRDISATPKTINTAGNVTPRSIGSKQGIFFDGSGDYLSLPLVSTSAMYLGTSDFTIEGWVYSLNTTISEAIINVGAHPFVTPDNYNSTVIENKSSGTCRFRIYNNATTACADYTWPAAATSNKWNHIALVKSGTTFKCFINGVSRTVTTVTAFTGNIDAEGTNRYWQFGRSGYDGSMQLYGYLTDVRVTGKALYTSNFTPPRRSGAF